jgi:hypothetical protein
VIAGSRRDRRPAAASKVALVAAVAAAAALLAACGPAPRPSPSLSASLPAPSPSLTATGSPTTGSPSSSAATLVAIDPSLLELLPADVAGHLFEPSAEAAAESASDPALAATSDGIAVAIAADPATSSFVVASVARLKPGVYDEGFFRDWRDSFDEAVCAQAGGVSGNAQAEIDGRTVYIGTCAGGSHTYHAHLEGANAILSVNAIGDARLGEELMKTLPD